MALFRVEQPLKLLQCNMDILTVTARLRVSRLKYHDLKFFRIRDRSILARSPPANCTTNPLKKKQEKSQSCGSMWNLYILDCPSFSDNIPSLCRRSWTDWCVEKLCFSGRQRIIWAKAADTQRSGWPDAKIVIFFVKYRPGHLQLFCEIIAASEVGMVEQTSGGMHFLFHFYTHHIVRERETIERKA